MRHYDFEAANRFIQMHSDRIETASLGMHEDWFWTAETVYEDGRFLRDLLAPDVNVGGITKSSWATPTLECEMKDGSLVRKQCFYGEADERQPEWFVLGPLSEPVQMEREGRYLEGSSDD